MKFIVMIMLLSNCGTYKGCDSIDECIQKAHREYNKDRR